MFEDKTLVCKDCGAEFIFSAGEQEFYAEKGFQNEPTRCRECRQAHKAARNNNGPREGGFRRNGQGGRPQGGRGPARDAAPRVWQPKAPAKSDNLSFEDMMSRFKSQSEEKMADLDHETNNRRGGGYAPRSRRGR